MPLDYWLGDVTPLIGEVVKLVIGIWKPSFKPSFFTPGTLLPFLYLILVFCLLLASLVITFLLVEDTALYLLIEVALLLD